MEMCRRHEEATVCVCQRIGHFLDDVVGEEEDELEEDVEQVLSLSRKCPWSWMKRTGCRTRWQAWNQDNHEVLCVALYPNPVFNEMWFSTIDPFIRISVFIAKLSERQYCWRVFEDFQVVMRLEEKEDRTESDTSPVLVSTTVDERSGKPDLDQAKKTPKNN